MHLQQGCTASTASYILLVCVVYYSIWKHTEKGSGCSWVSSEARVTVSYKNTVAEQSRWPRAGTEVVTGWKFTTRAGKYILVQHKIKDNKQKIWFHRGYLLWWVIVSMILLLSCIEPVWKKGLLWGFQATTRGQHISLPYTQTVAVYLCQCQANSK